jgi:recombination protein RecA
MDKKELNKAIIEIEKKFGAGSIMLLGNKKPLNIDVIPTGSMIIDQALGIGGYPRGRVVEIYGPESSGKTTLSLHAIAEAQKKGGIAAFIDAEHAIDPVYARNLGVDVDNLILSQPDSGEQALEIVDTLVKTGALDLIVVDSVAALVPQVELDGEMKDQTIGAQARLMSKALRKLTASLNKHKTTIIFINQIRMRIGIMFGNPETTSGGKALKFYSSIRLEVRRVSSIGKPGDLKGNNIKVKIVKNKLAPPYKVALTEIIFSKGISQESEIISLCLQKGILIANGAWIKYKDKNIAQGKEKLRSILTKDIKLKDELITLIKKQ